MLMHSSKCSQLLQSVFSGRKLVCWKKKILTLPWNLLGSLFIWTQLWCFVLWKISWIQHSSKLSHWNKIITWIALARAAPSVQRPGLWSCSLPKQFLPPSLSLTFISRNTHLQWTDKFTREGRRGLLPALGARPLLSHTFCLHCFSFPAISPSLYSIFCLFIFSLQCLETLFPFPASLFLPSFPLAYSFLPFFLSSFLPSQHSPWSFYSLFSPPSLPSGLPLMLQEVSSLPGVERRRTCHVQKNLRHRHPACQGTIHRSCFSCCFQSTGTSCVDCHVGVGTPKGSWETQHRVQRLETLTSVLPIVLWNPRERACESEWCILPQHPPLLQPWKQLTLEISKFLSPTKILTRIGCHQKGQLRPLKFATLDGRESSSSWRGQCSNVLPYL